MDNISIGKLGEKHAEYYLIKQGFSILEKNYRSKFGEIDIIAKKNNVIHFIEVKTRTTNRFGEPYEAVNKTKINKIIKTAFCYLNYKATKSIRLDILEVRISNNNFLFNLIENITF